MISAAWAGGKCDRIRAIVCGCSSMMKVSRFWLSTFCRKPNGRASICWRTLSSVWPAFLPIARSTRFLATSRPPLPPPNELGLASANSLMTTSCSSPVMLPSWAISIDTASTCSGVSLPLTLVGFLLGEAHQEDGRFSYISHSWQISEASITETLPCRISAERRIADSCLNRSILPDRGRIAGVFAVGPAKAFSDCQYGSPMGHN